MVGVPERGDHLALHVLVARRAPCAERALVVLRTIRYTLEKVDTQTAKSIKQRNNQVIIGKAEKGDVIKQLLKHHRTYLSLSEKGGHFLGK